MRILVLTNLYPPHHIGGYELRCRDVTESLLERGHQVAVLTSDHEVEGAGDESSTRYRVERSLRVHGFFGHPWLGIRDLTSLEEANNATLRRAIDRFQPDVVHVWNLGGISKSLILTLQSLDIPHVFDVSDHWIARSLKGDVWLDWWNRRETSLPARVQRGLWQLDGTRRRWQDQAPTNPLQHIDFQRLYFCSRKLRRITADAGYDVAHGEVIHCPVDTSRFQGEPRTADQPVSKLLYVGRLDPDKGIFTALKAMCQVRDLESVHLDVYGSGAPDYVRSLREFAERNRLPVSFQRARAEDMPSVYRSHDALVFTSEWEEPFALTPLEAMACGLPVIGTTTGGSAELFRDGENALTYEAGDSAALAARIRRLTGDPVLASALAMTGQAEVRARFPLPVIVDQIEEYLLETVEDWLPSHLPDYLAA